MSALRIGFCALLLLAAPSLATAQSSDASDWDNSSSAPAAECVPHCRSGYECRRGECLPVCIPACGEGYLCSTGGNCVRMAPPVSAQPVQTWSAPTNQCLPSCRVGYLCLGGQCVSACNPLCPAGETCTEHGQCVVAPPVSAQAAPTETAPPLPAPAPTAKDSIVNVHADVAGLLQFGLTPTVEVGKRYSGYLSVRPLNTGLASYYVLPRRDGEDLKWGLGGALGMHAFSAKEGNMRGIFGGPSVEYVFVKTAQPRLSKIYGTHVLMPQLDMGYRWGFDSFLLGIGGRIGLSVPVSAFDHGAGSSHCSGASDCDRKLKFLGGIVVDVGFFL